MKIKKGEEVFFNWLADQIAIHARRLSTWYGALRKKEMKLRMLRYLNRFVCVTEGELQAALVVFQSRHPELCKKPEGYAVHTDAKKPLMGRPLPGLDAYDGLQEGSEREH